MDLTGFALDFIAFLIGVELFLCFLGSFNS